MSIDSQELNITGGVKVSGHVKSNFGANFGVGTDAPSDAVHVAHTSPALAIQQQATSGGTVTSYGKVHADSGTLHIQSGVDGTSDSKGDIVLGSVGSATKHVVVKGATSNVGIGTDDPAYGLDVVPRARFTGNVVASNLSANAITLAELSLGVTQGLDNVVNVDNTTGNTIAMSNVTDSTSTTSGALTVAGGIGVGGNVHCSNLHASNITMNLFSFTGAQTFEQVVNTGRVLNSNVLIISNATPSTSASTGALTLTAGGLGVHGNVHVGTDGSLVVSNVAPATSASTGAVRIAGGLGVTGNAHVGEKLTVDGDAVTASNLEVQGGGLELTQVSNVAQIKSSSNVVAEFVRSKKLIKYPRVLLPYDAQDSQGGYENYIVDQSSVYTSESGQGAYLAFRNVGDHWLSSSTSFNGGDDVFNGTNGPWISIQLPNKIKLEYLEFYHRSGLTNQKVTAGSVYASNDGTNWTEIGSLSGLWTYDTTSVPARVNFTHATLYDRYLLHVTANQTNYVSMERLSFYGVPEYDPDAHGTDVIMRSAPNVPNTDWLEVYWDGQNYTSGTTVNDLSPNTNNGTLGTGVGFDTTYKAFTFDGTANGTITGSTTNQSGDWTHSTSFWVKIDTLKNVHFYQIGPETTNFDTTALYYGTAGFFQTSISGNGAYTRANASLIQYTWYHIVVVKKANEQDDIYLNSEKLTSYYSDGTQLSLPQNTSIILGHRPTDTGVDPLDGSIANFRLFNRALTADEVWQLYAYQKEYFDVSPDVVTFKGGCLGIGTSEPRAVLDVEGNTFSRKYNGGRSTFLTWDYIGSRSTSIGSGMYLTGGKEGSILDHEFDVPTCYHDLDTATLKAYVKIDWRGETQVPWNFLFKMKVYYNDYSSAYTLDCSLPDQAADDRARGCGVPTISYYSNDDFNSTPEYASVTSQFTLEGCKCTSGSKIKVELIGVNTHNTTVTTWTGRVKSTQNRADFEMFISSFFVALDVV